MSLLFDIRDIQTDKSAGLKTIPVLLGKSNTLKFSNVLLAAFLLLNFVGVFANEFSLKMAAGLITASFAWSAINSKLLRQQTFYYQLYVDGILVLNGLLLVIMFY